MELPSGDGAGTRGEIRSDVQQISSSASNRLHSEVDARKGTAATQARSLSSAIERAGGELDDGAPQWLRSAFQQGATQIQRFADTLEQKDSRQILNDVQDLARNNPGTFLAGCAALGFAAARVFKAGASESTTGSGSFEPQTYNTDTLELDPAMQSQGQEAMFRSPNISEDSSPTPAGGFA
jgi:hypothetical protein